MDFNYWKIGQDYSPRKLGSRVRNALPEFTLSFTYVPVDSSSPKISSVRTPTEFHLLEKPAEKGFSSLEIELLRAPISSEPRTMNYLWLKFLPEENAYQLTASIKSVDNRNFLRRPRQLAGLSQDHESEESEGPEELELSGEPEELEESGELEELSEI